MTEPGCFRISWQATCLQGRLSHLFPGDSEGTSFSWHTYPQTQAQRHFVTYEQLLPVPYTELPDSSTPSINSLLMVTQHEMNWLATSSLKNCSSFWVPANSLEATDCAHQAKWDLRALSPLRSCPGSWQLMTRPGPDCQSRLHGEISLPQRSPQTQL